MNPENPYSTPTADLGRAKIQNLPTVMYVFGFLSAIFSLWYLGFDGRKWFLPLKDMNTYELIREWVTRILYGLPKVGVIIGLVCLFKFKKQAFRVYLVCWVFAIGHTVMFYGAYDSVPMTDVEMLRMTVHHVIPHAFFIFMLAMLFMYRKAVDYPK